MAVPNAPCGVESIKDFTEVWVLGVFLMHRVELKGFPPPVNSKGDQLFLMHRVELKVKLRYSARACKAN